MRGEPLPIGWGLPPGATGAPAPRYGNRGNMQTEEPADVAEAHRRDVLLRMLEDEPALGTAQLVSRTGYPESTVQRVRREARELGIIL